MGRMGDEPYSVVSLPAKFMSITVASIFISSLFVNIIPFVRHDSTAITRMYEALLITILLLPELFLFVYRPLKSYVISRQVAEQNLKSLNRNLENAVSERTSELVELNKLLKEEYTESLRLSEEKYKNVIENLGVGVSLIGLNMEILSTNNHVKRWFPHVDFSKNTVCYQTFVNPPRACACEGCPVEKTLADGNRYEMTLEVTRGMEKRNCRIISSPLTDKDGNIIAAIKVMEDITERKLAEDTLRNLNENLEQKVRERTFELQNANLKLEREVKERRSAEVRYRSLIRQSSEGVFVFDPDTRIIQEANNRILTMLGYLEEEVVGQKLEKIVASDKKFLINNIQKMIDEDEAVAGPRQYRHKNGSLIDVEISASIIRYNNAKVVLANIKDISDRKRAEEALKETFKNLKSTLNETVNALVATAEKRDPYTAGHQYRVAMLACAIAREMGLPEKQIEGILIAGKLHDIGKIYVPIDILNKPGRLTDMEMGLIKSHTQIGYEILQKIPFENPVAESVMQHHEKLDGSGYPSGLKSENILLEAKILCVADVVEAMASHRPYRPALGIHKALEEILSNRGVLYDAEVVDGCLRVFNNNRFKFDTLAELA